MCDFMLIYKFKLLDQIETHMDYGVFAKIVCYIQINVFINKMKWVIICVWKFASKYSNLTSKWLILYEFNLWIFKIYFTIEDVILFVAF